MYSVILMAALSTSGPDAVAFGRHGGCHGCHCYGGCYSYSYYCWGGCYGGCYGSCMGCYGAYSYGQPVWYGDGMMQGGLVCLDLGDQMNAVCGGLLECFF